MKNINSFDVKKLSPSYAKSRKGRKLVEEVEKVDIRIAAEFGREHVHLTRALHHARTSICRALTP